MPTPVSFDVSFESREACNDTRGVCFTSPGCLEANVPPPPLMDSSCEGRARHEDDHAAVSLQHSAGSGSDCRLERSASDSNRCHDCLAFLQACVPLLPKLE